MSSIRCLLPFLALVSLIRPASAEGSTSRWSRVEETLAAMAAKGLAPGEPELADQLALAAVLAADPGGEVLSREDAATLEEEGRGRVPNCGWILSATNNLVVFKSSLRPDANPGLPVDYALTSLDGNPLGASSWSSVQAGLRGGTERTLNGVLTDPGTMGTTNIALAVKVQPEAPIALHETWLSDFRYIRVNGFYPDSRMPFLKALGNTVGLRGVLVDLRNAGGSDEASAVACARALVPNTVALGRWTRPDGKALGEIKLTEEGGVAISSTVILLVNRDTRGAAELFAALLRHSGSESMVVGEVPAGDPLLRESLPLGDRVLRVATRRLVLGDGTVLDARKRLQPDVEIEDADISEVVLTGGVDGSSNPHRTGLSAEYAARDALRQRLRHDGPLQRAMDILLGLRLLPGRARNGGTP